MSTDPVTFPPGAKLQGPTWQQLQARRAYGQFRDAPATHDSVTMPWAAVAGQCDVEPGPCPMTFAPLVQTGQGEYVKRFDPQAREPIRVHLSFGQLLVRVALGFYFGAAMACILVWAILVWSGK